MASCSKDITCLFPQDALSPASLVKFLVASVTRFEKDDEIDQQSSEYKKTIIDKVNNIFVDCIDMLKSMKSTMEQETDMSEVHIVSPNISSLSSDMIFSICGFLGLSNVLNIRLSTVSIHETLRDFPADLCMLNPNITSPIATLLKSVSMLCYYKETHVQRSKNKTSSNSNLTSHQQVSIISPSVSYEQSLTPLISEQSQYRQAVEEKKELFSHFTLTSSQLASFRMDRCWKVIGIPLNNFFHASQLIDMLTMLKNEDPGLHRFVKKLGIEPLIQNILPEIQNAHQRGLLPHLEEISCVRNLTCGKFTNRIVSFDPLSRIFSLQKIVFLCSSVCGNISSFSDLINVETLSLMSIGIIGSLRSLVKLHQLKCLILQSTKIVGNLDILEHLHNLEVVEFRHNSFDINLYFFSNLFKLKKLCLSHFGQVEQAPPLGFISDESEASSSKAQLTYLSRLTKLEVIEIRYIKMYGFLRTFSNMIHLKELYLSSCIIKGNLSSLSTLQHLEILELLGKYIEGDLQSLSHMKKMRKLLLSNTKVTGDISSLILMKDLECLNLNANLFNKKTTQKSPIKGDITRLCVYCVKLSEYSVRNTHVTE